MAKRTIVTMPGDGIGKVVLSDAFAGLVGGPDVIKKGAASTHQITDAIIAQLR
jgi:hypothetical protein